MRVAIVGAGLAGATVAAILSKKYDVTVFEERPHVGGNCYTERDPDTGIMLHKYGPHIFHTNNPTVIKFVESYGVWEPFQLRMKSMVGMQVYSAPPINLHTINQVFQYQFSPDQARAYIAKNALKIDKPANFEEAALATVGPVLYEMFLKHYTAKQWGRDPREIPASVYGRLPLRFSYDDNKYPTHEWQAMPAEGYTTLVQRMLLNSAVVLNCPGDDSLVDRYDHVFWSGPIDQFFGYRYGNLEYRTLDFEVLRLPEEDAQGAPVIVYPEAAHDWTRITEHKHFSPWNPTSKSTVLYRERSRDWTRKDIPYYPVRLAKDKANLEQYLQAAVLPNVTFLGRLGTYQYMDMEAVIWQSIQHAHSFVRRHST